ncbi:MAG: hypothetical protein ACE5MG_11785, partial [Candidatus Methylomirabilales bacterium]
MDRRPFYLPQGGWAKLLFDRGKGDARGPRNPFIDLLVRLRMKLLRVGKVKEVYEVDEGELEVRF